MPEVQKLLNDDGSASVATAVLMSHHAFRRDIALFAHALAKVRLGDASRAEALHESWQFYRNALHGHHEAEDTKLFPHLLSEQPQLKDAVARLTAEHRQIDPLIEQGDAAFADLRARCADASRVVGELSTLLDTHLAYEEAEALKFLRNEREFPPAQSEDEERMIVEGFAWSSHGVAPEVLAEVYNILPEALRVQLPAARAAYKERCERAWGTSESGASRTCVPDWLSER
jgi:hemerythrin-like domain-containing protein